MKRGPRKRQLKPKTPNQAEYIRTIVENDVTFCVGPAGTGKTSIAVGLACEHLKEGKVQKIIITRPVVESGRTGLGFLPGSFQEKIHPYLIPVLEEMKLFLTDTLVKKYMSDGTIEVVPLEYMRGRNFHNCFMILDEAQNTTHEQIKMFITRIGRKSKAVVNGDIEQSDLPPSARGALAHCLDRLKDTNLVGTVELTDDDIIRNRIISAILARLK